MSCKRLTLCKEPISPAIVAKCNVQDDKLDAYPGMQHAVMQEIEQSRIMELLLSDSCGFDAEFSLDAEAGKRMANIIMQQRKRDRNRKKALKRSRHNSANLLSHHQSSN